MVSRSTFTLTGSNNRKMLCDITFAHRKVSAPLIIFVHGFKGFKDWGTHQLVANYFAMNGFNFLKFNFSHNGTTPENPVDFVDLDAFGKNTFSKELADLDTVIAFASTYKSIATREIILLGHSRGGGISIISANHNPKIAKLVTWASISNFRKLWQREKEKEWRETGVIYTFNGRTKQNMPLYKALLDDLNSDAERLDIMANAARLSVPWLIVSGGKDEIVSTTQAEALHAQCLHSILAIIPNGNHVFGASHPYEAEQLPETLKEVCDRTIRFLKTGH